MSRARSTDTRLRAAEKAQDRVRVLTERLRAGLPVFPGSLGEDCHSVLNGNGYGYGDGNGDDNGYGNGNGNGYGDGDNYGYGYGDGYGDGYGYGYGDGYGNGHEGY